MSRRRHRKPDWAAKLKEPSKEEDQTLVVAAESDPDNPPIAREEMMAMRPARRPGERGKQKAPTKVLVSLRIDRDVIEYFRASGVGWQTRINNALKKLAARESRTR